jgi:hypothetical protein
MGSQCYGFITLPSREEAHKLLAVLRDCGPITVNGATLRVDWAQGSLPEWKRQGPALYRTRSGSAGMQVRGFGGSARRGAGAALQRGRHCRQWHRVLALLPAHAHTGPCSSPPQAHTLANCPPPPTAPPPAEPRGVHEPA